MQVPAITHQQTLVLSILSDGERWGRDVRQEMSSHNVTSSGAAFYQMMARMEEAGMIRGAYETKVVDGQTIKQRKYHIRPKGQRALAGAVEFYVEAARLAGVALA